ncbi:MAG: hypothetical protein QW567_03250 [Candidatus Hadarchaeales archaeon]
MRSPGIGAAADLLSFAALISVSLGVLAASLPAEAHDLELMHAREVGRGVVLTLGTVPVREIGGLRYGALLPPFSSEVEINDRTALQLVGECWAVHGHGQAIRENMEDGLREFLEKAMEQMLGGRFSYRLSAGVVRGGEEAFVLGVENLSGDDVFLCSESLTVPFLLQLPGAGAPESFLLYVKLELWSG